MIRLRGETGEEYLFPASLHRVNVVEQTFRKLLESLKDDSDDPVNQYIHREYEEFRQDSLNYGIEVLFFDEVGEENGRLRPRVLIKLPPVAVWKLAITLSNGNLINDKKADLDWYTTRLGIFSRQQITVAGASVASQAALFAVRLIRPFRLTLADPKGANASNMNRTQYSLLDLLEDPATQQEVSKAIALARHIHWQDPFQLIHVYPEGITDENMEEYLTPRPSVLLEAIDHFPIKYALLQKARALDIPTIQLADVGSRAINGFNSPGDEKKRVDLLYGLNDKAVAEAFNNPTPETFILTAMLASGATNALMEPAGRRFLTQKEGCPFKSVPQTGDVAGASGVMAARNAARFLVEANRNPSIRFKNRQQVFDLRTGKTIHRYRNTLVNKVLNRIIKKVFK